MNIRAAIKSPPDCDLLLDCDIRLRVVHLWLFPLVLRSSGEIFFSGRPATIREKKTSLRTPSFHLIGSQDSVPDGCDLRPRGSSTRPSSHCRHDVPADFTLPPQQKTQRPLTLSSQRASLPTFITASRLATHSANGHVVISDGRNEWIIQQVAAPKIHSGATYHHLHCKWSLLRGFKVSIFHTACVRHNPGAPEHFSLWQLVLGFFFQRKKTKKKAFMLQVLFYSRTPWHMEPLHFIKS